MHHNNTADIPERRSTSQENETMAPLHTHAESAGRAALQRVEEYNLSSKLPNRRDNVESFCWSDINLGRLLDKGSFSNVYEATLRRDTAQPPTVYAVKCLRENVTEHEDTFVTGAVDLALEAKLLAKIMHPNLVKLHGCTGGCVSESFRVGAGFFLVLDLLVDTLNKRLARWRREQKSSPPLWSCSSKRNRQLHDRIETVALGVAQGLEYLHSQKIMYRDLKPHNIGFDEHGRVRIFDFGLAREADSKGTLRQMTGNAGTPRYMAPEVARNISYGFPSDVYSFSILLWEIMTLGKPFESIKSLAQFNEEVVRGNLRPALKRVNSPNLKALLERSWDADPSVRPTFSSVIETLEEQLSDDNNSNRPTLLRKLSSLAVTQKSFMSSQDESSSERPTLSRQESTSSSVPKLAKLFFGRTRTTSSKEESSSPYRNRTWVQRTLLRKTSMSMDLSLRSMQFRPRYDLGHRSSSLHNESSQHSSGSFRRRSSGASESNKNAMAEVLAAEAKSSRQALRELQRSKRKTS